MTKSLYVVVVYERRVEAGTRWRLRERERERERGGGGMRVEAKWEQT